MIGEFVERREESRDEVCFEGGSGVQGKCTGWLFHSMTFFWIIHVKD